jgi:hypothetical protein
MTTQRFVLCTTLLVGFAGLCACAVDVAEFEPPTISTFDAPSQPIAGAYTLSVAADDVLAITTNALGVTCSGVAVSGDFRARFIETAEAAFAGVFTGGPASPAYELTLTPAVDDVRIVFLRRSALGGVTRVAVSLGAEMTVRTPTGGETTLTVAPADTLVEVERPAGQSCDSGARGLDTAVTQSMELLLESLRGQLLAARPA